jgi:hypothetical protein
MERWWINNKGGLPRDWETNLSRSTLSTTNTKETGLRSNPDVPANIPVSALLIHDRNIAIATLCIEGQCSMSCSQHTAKCARHFFSLVYYHFDAVFPSTVVAHQVLQLKFCTNCTSFLVASSADVILCEYWKYMLKAV